MAKAKVLGASDSICEVAAIILAVTLMRDGEASEMNEAKRQAKCRAAVAWARSLIVAAQEPQIAEGGAK